MRQGRKRNPALARITVTYSFWENSETQSFLTNTLRLFVEVMLWAWYVGVFIPHHFQSSHNRAMQKQYRCWRLEAEQAGTNVAGGRGWQEGTSSI